MSTTVDATTDLDAAVEAAAAALRAGKLVSLPTDTVYGVAADAFNPVGTAAVFTAKRRNRTAPLPVLVRSPKQLLGLVTTVPETANRLMAAYWPGPLTIVVRSEPHLAWDLGDSQGTVAVRMPFDDATLAIITTVGPLAVTSANLSGNPAATTAALARAQLGDAVEVYVDAGPRTDTTPSTIVDLTRTQPRILRSGPLDDAEVLRVARGEIPAHEVTPYTPSTSESESLAPEVGVATTSASVAAAATASDAAGGDDAGDIAGNTAGANQDNPNPAVATRAAENCAAGTSPAPSKRHIAKDHRAGR